MSMNHDAWASARRWWTFPGTLPAPAPGSSHRDRLVPTVTVEVTDLPTTRALPQEINLLWVVLLTVSSSRADVLGA
jgi:hypothetical protein